MSIPFSKMSGAGNTFVVIDNREGVVESTLAELALTMDALVIRICSTVTGVGSDGLILIENTADYDFAWRFFNSDGSHANMCGNGARCAARFASMEGISGITAAFETGAGVVHSEVQGERVRVTLTDPGEITPDIELTLAGDKYRCHRIDTGVPHLVVPVDSVNDVDIVQLGSEGRYHERFAPDGVNVNVVSQNPDGDLKVRTYERGVEGETMACGTGVTAAALVFARLKKVGSPVTVTPLSGERLQVHFEEAGERFKNVIIEGPAHILFNGRICAEALR